MVVMKTGEEEGGRNGGESEKRGASRFTIWAFTFCDFSTRRTFLGSEKEFLKSFLGSGERAREMERANLL